MTELADPRRSIEDTLDELLRTIRHMRSVVEEMEQHGREIPLAVDEKMHEVEELALKLEKLLTQQPH